MSHTAIQHLIDALASIAKAAATGRVCNDFVAEIADAIVAEVAEIESSTDAPDCDDEEDDGEVTLDPTFGRAILDKWGVVEMPCDVVDVPIATHRGRSDPWAGLKDAHRRKRETEDGA